MERFWRTLREGCLDFLGDVESLHDVNVRLWAFLDGHYHQAAHASLLGKTPKAVFAETPQKPDSFDEQKLRDSLTTRIRRRVRQDGTIAMDGVDYEVDGAHLAGRLANLCRCLVDLNEAPWLEIEGQRLKLHPVDPVANGKRRRAHQASPEERLPIHPAFEPAQTLLDTVLGRGPRSRRGEA